MITTRAEQQPATGSAEHDGSAPETGAAGALPPLQNTRTGEQIADAILAYAESSAYDIRQALIDAVTMGRNYPAPDPDAPERPFTVIGAWIGDVLHVFGVIEGEHSVSGGDEHGPYSAQPIDEWGGAWAETVHARTPDEAERKAIADADEDSDPDGD